MDKIPILGPLALWLGIPFFSAEQSAFFYNSIVQAIRHRQETGTRRNDLIDLMIEAMTTDLSHEFENNDHASDQFEKDAMLHDKKRRKRISKDINELDIVATAMAMLTAGYDTTAQTLIYIGLVAGCRQNDP